MEVNNFLVWHMYIWIFINCVGVHTGRKVLLYLKYERE